MRGAWLVKFGRWIARQETFEKTVAPAISDMQVEASCGRMHRWKHYVAIGLVLVHALLHDLRFDLASVFDAETRRLVWKQAAIYYAGAVAFPTILFFLNKLRPGLSLEGIWPAATSALLEQVVNALFIPVAVAVFYLNRKATSRRAIVLVTLLAVVFTMALALSVRPIRISADQFLYDSIGHSSYRAARLDPQITWWKDIQSGVFLIPGAILAVLLSRRRGGIRVAAIVACFFASWFLAETLWNKLAVESSISQGRYQLPSEIMQGWRAIAFSLVLAIVWLTIDNLYRRYRLHDPN